MYLAGSWPIVSIIAKYQALYTAGERQRKPGRDLLGASRFVPSYLGPFCCLYEVNKS